MKTSALAVLTLILLVVPAVLRAQDPPRQDVIQTAAGPLAIDFIGHGTLMFRFHDVVVHVDPISAQADYATLPKADVVLVTHEHGDHLDPKAIAAVRKPSTVVLVSSSAAGRVEGSEVMKNGEIRQATG